MFLYTFHTITTTKQRHVYKDRAHVNIIDNN
ncbi:hypothetical protein BRC2024_OFSGVTRC_CDS_0049 [Acinetobacter phage vB_AbaM_Rocket]